MRVYLHALTSSNSNDIATNDLVENKTRFVEMEQYQNMAAFWEAIEL